MREKKILIHFCASVLCPAVFSNDSKSVIKGLTSEVMGQVSVCGEVLIA